MSKLVAELTHPEPWEIEHVIENLRDQDFAEVVHAHGDRAYDVIRGGCEFEDAYVGRYRGEPICLFGVAPRTLISGGGTAWMVGTRGVEDHSITFLRHSRKWVAAMMAKYGYLENYVDSRNTVAIEWLKWLGFRFGEKINVRGVSFIHFSKGEL